MPTVGVMSVKGGKWADASAFEEHKQQPHFARLGELKAEYVEDTAIEIYES